MSPEVLTEGTWTPRGGILVWQPAGPVVIPFRTRRKGRPRIAARPRERLDLIACLTCRALIHQRCRTASGEPDTDHAGRLVARRCPCGGLLRPFAQLCLDCRTAHDLERHRRYARRKRSAA